MPNLINSHENVNASHSLIFAPRQTGRKREKPITTSAGKGAQEHSYRGDQKLEIFSGSCTVAPIQRFLEKYSKEFFPRAPRDIYRNVPEIWLAGNSKEAKCPLAGK